MNASPPRAVVVTRETDYELLLARHATRGQARFFLERRGQCLDELEARHQAFTAALKQVKDAVPADWRMGQVRRRDLDRFIFEPKDLILAVGQDGLVANTAKYLNGQAVLGINPDPGRYDGILVPLRPGQVETLLAAAHTGSADFERRAMVEACLDDGQRLLALNEIFVGQRSHQSARYRLHFGSEEECQSSSGIIVATGTGATGWAKSIAHDRQLPLGLAPCDEMAVFFVREAFPSVATQAGLNFGTLGAGQALTVVSEMDDNGVIFGDGIEADRYGFDWGRRAEIKLSDRKLALVQP